MCNFISWIKIERDGEIIVLYLTDDEVFSRDGRERLKGCRDSDFIGHGAVRAFFDLRPREGRSREAKKFWNPNAPMPEEIKVKLVDIPNFDKHWGRMFASGFFQNADLRRIICQAPDEWKVKALEQLFRQDPSSRDLRCVIYNAPDEWKVRAWKQLLSKGPDNSDLCSIIYNAPDEWKVRAREQLSQQNPSASDLLAVASVSGLQMVAG